MFDSEVWLLFNIQNIYYVYAASKNKPKNRFLQKKTSPVFKIKLNAEPHNLKTIVIHVKIR